MRYYELDAEGRVLGDFGAPQPGRELVLLRKRPSPYHMFVNNEWKEDTKALDAEARRLLNGQLKDRLLEEIIEHDASLAAAKGVLAANRDAWLAEIKSELRKGTR